MTAIGTSAIALVSIAALILAGSLFGIVQPLMAPSMTKAASSIPAAIRPAQETPTQLSKTLPDNLHTAAIAVHTPSHMHAATPSLLGSARALNSPLPRADPCKHTKCVALTFDDGPGPYTRHLLTTLRKHHVHATFFLIGKRVKHWGSVARAEVAQGNEICGHSWSHKDLGEMSHAAIRRDTQKVIKTIHKATGVTITCMRPPYGALTAKQAKATGLKNYLWDVDTLDWKTLNTKKTIKAATRHIRPGSIIIMHDIHKSTVNGVPKIIKKLKHKGFRLVTVDQLLTRDHPQPGHKYFAR